MLEKDILFLNFHFFFIVQHRYDEKLYRCEEVWIANVILLILTNNIDQK